VLHERQGYGRRLGLPDGLPKGSTHLIWATGGGMVPETEMAAYLNRG